MEDINVLHPFEDEIINIGTRTALKLLSLGADELALYTFYCITAKRQSIALQKRISTVKATENYCMLGLGWGQFRYRNAKRNLLDNGLIKTIIKKDELNKVIGHYVKLEYVPLVNMESQTFKKPLDGKSIGWVTPPVEKTTPNTVKDNINTVKENINTGRVHSVGEPSTLAKDLLIHFNTVYNTKFTAYLPIIKPLEHWLASYSIDEIKQAITNSKQDSWWADKLTPTILLRRMNPNHEAVDYIGKFLNMTPVGTFDATPLTDLQLWTIAKEREINLEDVKQKHKDVLSEAEKGSFPVKYKYENVEQAVRAWVDMGISKGQIKPCNELELMQLDNDHPDRVKEREYYFGLMKEKGELE